MKKITATIALALLLVTVLIGCANTTKLKIVSEEVSGMATYYIAELVLEKNTEGIGLNVDIAYNDAAFSNEARRYYHFNGNTLLLEQQIYVGNFNYDSVDALFKGDTIRFKIKVMNFDCGPMPCTLTVTTWSYSKKDPTIYTLNFDV